MHNDHMRRRCPFHKRYPINRATDRFPFYIDSSVGKKPVSRVRFAQHSSRKTLKNAMVCNRSQATLSILARHQLVE